MPKLTQDTRPDIDNVIQVSTSKPLGLIPAWSHSTLKTFETCAYRSYIAKVKRINKPYARKIQILTVLEQRAEVMGKMEQARLARAAKKQLKAQRKHV